MGMYLTNLLKPLDTSNLYLKNRLIMPPLATSKAEPDGSVSGDMLDYYDEKSKDGCKSLIIVEHSFISCEGKVSERQLSVAEDRMIAGLQKLASVIHSNGSKAVMQINHGGSGANSRVTGIHPVGPSSVINPRIAGEIPRELSIEDIEDIIKAFKKAAIRVKEAGFDGVEIHSAHGYLLNQFFSPLTNKRIDRYGGTPDKRIQIHLEVIKAVRDGVGPDFPILLRLGAADYMEGGSTVKDSKIAVKKFEEAGIDIIDVSGGFCGYILEDNKEQGYFSALSEEIKSSIKIPVILTGGITKAAFADKLIFQHKADLIGVGRAIVKESDWAKRELSEA